MLAPRRTTWEVLKCSQLWQLTPEFASWVPSVVRIKATNTFCEAWITIRFYECTKQPKTVPWSCICMQISMNRLQNQLVGYEQPLRDRLHQLFYWQFCRIIHLAGIRPTFHKVLKWTAGNSFPWICADTSSNHSDERGKRDDGHEEETHALAFKADTRVTPALSAERHVGRKCFCKPHLDCAVLTFMQYVSYHIT